jgi:NADPH:quinone reductase-like Zn-dependent oxidoreductase
MKALHLASADGLGSAALADVDCPDPQAGEVRVRLRASALNHRELWIVQGQYPGMRLPCTMGCDGSGIIESLGSKCSGLEAGVEVALYPGLKWGGNPDFPASEFGLLGMPGPGTIAEYICVPAENAVVKPSSLTFEEAAATGLAGLTAWRALITKARLRAGERVLITGIGGGVATFALHFAVALGATVFVSSGSAATLEKARESGAAAGFNYNDADWRKSVAKVTGGGIDVVIDGAPAASYANYSRALTMGARIVVYGSTGGAPFTVNAPELFLKNLALMGTNVGNLEEYKAMLAFVEEHGVRPAIDRSFAFAEAANALQYLATGHRFGKVTITL